ncbi:MAG TPA: DNA translocase FtsK 4TM domain-containing protein, partial [Candidatus Sulfotelmatobacter sp.]|nr:DNA translocase FtsK 4TM domain-containing protein [Candidatus Sulfotelmatobacter sp.]
IFGTLLVIAWLSYNPLDPAPNVAAPGPVRNLLGSFGADASDLGLRTLGIAYLLLIFVLLAWGWRLFVHRGISRLGTRLAALPIVLVAGAIALGALPLHLPDNLPAGPGGWIAQIALPGIAWLGPLLGGLSRGTLGLIASGVAGVALVFVLGFSPGEWRSFGVGTAAALVRAGVAARASAESGRRMGAEAARAGLDRALRGMRREPHLGGAASDAAEPTMGGLPPTAPVVGVSAVAREISIEPTARVAPAMAPDAGHADDTAPPLPGVALPIVERPVREVAREPAREVSLVEPRAERAPARARPKAQQTTLDLVPNEYHLPPTDLLKRVIVSTTPELDTAALEQNARLLESVLQDFGVRGEIVKVRPGPVVTLYELEPAPGTKSSRVIGLADDIARSMSAIAVRIAVVPGRSVIGIELPNAKRETIYLRDILTAEAYEQTANKLALVLGKDIGGTPIVVDLARMPHLLIAGTTGSGKSVGINTMIMSLVYRLPPERCRFIMIDPKMLELSVYDGIPHLLAPVVTDPKKAVVALKWAVKEMETRYRAMSKLGVRNLEGYNARVDEITKNGEQTTRKVQTGFDETSGEPIFEEQPLDLRSFPYIVVIVDEMADLMLVAGKDIEAAIQRLAQMARAAGIHLIMATQRPSVDVITGTIKANFPTRVSFQVTSKIDSRTILGEAGAEQLLGQGDMLYMAGGGRITRVHGPFVSDTEVEQVVKFLKSQGQPEYLDAVTEDADAADGEGGAYDPDGGGSGDDLYDQAVALVARERKASTSFVQRYLQIGYNRAARLIEKMEAEGVVSPANHVG